MVDQLVFVYGPVGASGMRRNVNHSDYHSCIIDIKSVSVDDVSDSMKALFLVGSSRLLFWSVNK